MALFKANLSYKIGQVSYNKHYMVYAVSVKQAFVKLFDANPDLNTVTEVTVVCETSTCEILN